MLTTFIYTLSDPRTGQIRYVGKSDDPFARFAAHLRDKICSHKRNWIESLKRLSLLPLFNLLDEVPIEHWQFWEREYIRLFKMLGCPIINQTSGGDGVDNASPEIESKRVAGIRKAMTKESRSRRSKKLRGVPKSLSMRQKLSRSWTL